MKKLKKSISSDIRGKEYIKILANAVNVFAKYFDKQVQDYIDYIEQNPQMFITVQKMKKMSNEDLNIMEDEIVLNLSLAFLSWNEFQDLETQKELTVWVSFDLDNKYAIDWWKENTGKLIKWINETTQEEIQKVISDALENGKTSKETIQLIKDKFLQYSQYRASLIANMEVSNAFAQWRKIQFWKYQKYFSSEWWKRSQTQWDDTVRATHVANQAEWRIPANQEFKATQTLCEPHWFNCRCVVAYRLTKPSDE